MIDSKTSLSLTIRLTEEQLGFLACAFPNDDPEEALIKLLERARSRAIHRAEQQVRVLRLGQEEAKGEQAITPEQPVSQVADELENPIGELQELCQKQRISVGTRVTYGSRSSSGNVEASESKSCSPEESRSP